MRYAKFVGRVGVLAVALGIGPAIAGGGVASADDTGASSGGGGTPAKSSVSSDSGPVKVDRARVAHAVRKALRPAEAARNRPESVGSPAGRGGVSGKGVRTGNGRTGLSRISTKGAGSVDEGVDADAIGSVDDPVFGQAQDASAAKDTSDQAATTGWGTDSVGQGDPADSAPDAAMEPTVMSDNIDGSVGVADVLDRFGLKVVVNPERDAGGVWRAARAGNGSDLEPLIAAESIGLLSGLSVPTSGSASAKSLLAVASVVDGGGAGWDTAVPDDTEPVAPRTMEVLASAERKAASQPQQATSASLISGLLSVMGLRSVVAPDSPAAPAETPVEWALLAWIRRQFEYTFENATPVSGQQEVAANLEVGSDETAELTLTGSDGDPEDSLTYEQGTVTGTSGGTLHIEGDTATYTPRQDWDGQAYTDTFTVTLSDADNPWHVHGFDGLLNALTFGLLGEEGHTATATVTVNVSASVEIDDGGPGLGTETGTIDLTDPDGGTVDFSAPDGSGSTTWFTAAGGTVSVDADGNYTYTPDPMDRLNAYSHPDQGTDTFDVLATYSDGSTETITVSVPIDPASAAVVSTVHGDGEVWTTVGDDGTVYRLTRTGSGSAGNPYQTRVTVMHPDGDEDIITVDGSPAGPVVSTDAGTIYQTTYTGSGTAGDPFETTVTVISADGARDSIAIDGLPLSSPQVGTDGKVYQTTKAGAGLTTLTVLHPDGHTSTINLDGEAYSPVILGDDGNAYQTTRTDFGTAIVTVVHSDGSSNSFTLDGDPSGSPVVGVDGTIYQTTYTGTLTVVNIVHPNGGVDTIEIDGTPSWGQSLVVNGDGTVYQSTRTGNGSADNPHRTTLTVVHTDGSQDSVTADGNLDNMTVADDGTVYVVSRGGSGQPNDPDVTIVTVAHPNGSTDTITLDGYPSGTLVGADGTFIQTVGTGLPSQGVPYETAVTVVHPHGSQVTFTAEGRPIGPAVLGADGTIYQVSTAGAGTVDDPDRTIVAVLRPNGDRETIEVAGVASGPLVVAGDGAYLTTLTGAGAVEHHISVIELADPPLRSL